MTRLNIWHIFGLTCFASFITAAPNLEGRIVGGYEADINDMTFIVVLQNTYQFCGGSLIAKRFIITAAHCTYGRNSANPGFLVRLASKYSANGGLLVKAIQIFQHKDYDAAKINFDFSIVKIEDYKESSLPFQIQYAQLPGEDNIEDNTELTVAGWGFTYNNYESRSVLRAVKVFKVNADVCKQAYSKFNDITDQMLCAGHLAGGKDACQCDSGGPLFIDNTIWGVVSWGYGCAKPNYPGVYARITSAREWILTTIKDE